MPLPKIQYPAFTIEIPSTKKKEMFRPFLVKEEKILLMAKSSGLDSDVLLAIKQVVNNCALDDKFDIDKLSLFDLEYCFIKIRAASVSNIINVSYKDFEDEKSYEFEIDLNNVTIQWPENIKDKVQISETSGFSLKYPKVSLYEDKEFLDSGVESFFKLIVRSIDIIYDGDNVHPASNYTLQEIEDYLENLDVNSFEQVRNFIMNQPSLYYKIEYKNSLGNDRLIELRTLNDFFMFR